MSETGLLSPEKERPDTPKKSQKNTYRSAGVDLDKENLAMTRLFPLLRKTFKFRDGVGRVLTDLGQYSGVIQLDGICLAIKTDGVGSKVIIAQMMQKYDTIGIDCVAMNVNDVVCSGAEPVSFVDYIAIQDPDPEVIEQIGIGLVRGAEIAKVSIVGGETAVLKDMIKGGVKNRGLDLAGMCVGVVEKGEIVDGASLNEGDALVGIRSSGIHSNGLTLARKILLRNRKFSLDRYFEQLGRSLGDELLEPTAIYVPEILEMLRSNLHVKAMAHITSKGFLNLTRMGQNHGYVIDKFPAPHPIFQMIQRYGEVSDEEMYRTFNMGIGFTLVLPKTEVDEAFQIIERHHKEPFVLGYSVEDAEKKIIMKPQQMVGLVKQHTFRKL